jgi:hypothetical protein
VDGDDVHDCLLRTVVTDPAKVRVPTGAVIG